MAPVLYLKYLLLGKLWLFMTEKKELGKTRTYIAKLLRVPKGVSEWAERERVPWLALCQWNTRFILKNMTLLGALETFYGERREEISASRDRQSSRKKSSATLPQKIKPETSKSFAKRNIDVKVNIDNSEEFCRSPVIEVDNDEDVKPQIVYISSSVADEEALSCSTRTNESVEKQKNKRKSVTASAPKGKKRKILNHVEEEVLLPVTSTSTLLQNTKSGSSKPSAKKNKNNNVSEEEKTDNNSTFYKIAEKFPKTLISKVDSDTDKDVKPQSVDLNNYVVDEGASICSTRTNESVVKQKHKRKSVKALSLKGKNTNILNGMEEEASLHVTSASTVLQSTKSGLSKPSVKKNKNKNVSKEEKEDNTFNKIAEGFRKALISEVDSDKDMEHELQTVAVNNHDDEQETLLDEKRTVERVRKKGAKRKSKEALVQKVKKRKVKNNREETNAALTSKRDIAHKKKHENLEKEYKETSSINTESSKKRNSTQINVNERAEFMCESSCILGVMSEIEHLPENITSSPPTGGQPQALKKLHKKLRKRRKNSLVDKEDEIRGHHCQFVEVSECSDDAVSLGTLKQKERIGSPGKEKLLKKQCRIRRESMTFTVTDLEINTDNIVEEELGNTDSKDNEEPSASENSETEAAMPTGKQKIEISRNMGAGSHKELDWNDSSATEYYRLHNLRATKCDTGSEDSSDYDRSDGDDNNLGSFKVTSELENFTSSCKEERENMSKTDSDEDQTLHMHDSEQKDASKGSNEDSDDSNGIVLVAKCNKAQTSDNDPCTSHERHEFGASVTDNDTDDSSENVMVECKKTGNDVTVDKVQSDEDDEIIVENAPNEVNGEWDSMLGTSNRSGIFEQVNNEVPSVAPEKLMKKPCDNSKENKTVSGEESNSEGEIAITKCRIQKLHDKDIKLDHCNEETVDLSNSDQDEDNVVTTDGVEILQHNKHSDIDKVNDTKISNSIHVVTVPGSENEVKAMKDEMISKINEVPQLNLCDIDCDTVVASDSDQDIISCKVSDKKSPDEIAKIHNEFKAEPEVENLMKEEVKQHRNTQQTSPNDEKNTKRTTTLHNKHTECKNDASQDPVSKMMNNLYKLNVVKSQDEEKGRSNIQIQSSQILSSQHPTVAKTTDYDEDEKKYAFCRQSSSLVTDDNDDDDKSVEIVDNSEEIESMLQNIVQDTGRPTSIRGLREKLLSRTAVKGEAKENSDHEVVKDDKELIKINEISPSCDSQVHIHASVDHQSLGSLESSGDMNGKSVEHVEYKEDIESLLQDIVKDASQLAGIRGLRERLLCKATEKKETEKEGTVREGTEKEGTEKEETEIEGNVREGTEKEGSEKKGIEKEGTVREGTEKEGTEKEETMKEEIEKEGTEKEGTVKEGTMIGETMKEGTVKEGTEKEGTEKEGTVKESTMIGETLKERTVKEGTMKEETTEISEHKVKKDDKEAAEDCEASPCESQVKTSEESNKKEQLKEVVDEVLLSADKLLPSKYSVSTCDEKDNLMDEMHMDMEEVDSCLSNLNSEDNLSIPNNDEIETTDGSSKGSGTTVKKQDPNDDKNFQDRELKMCQSDEQVSITSDTRSNLVSANGVEATEEITPKPLEAESLATNGAEGLSDVNAALNCSITLELESSNTEIESAIDESGDKSTEGADEAYEASSDASEDPAPRTRRRSRSLRKSCPHQLLQQASDSDSSPVRAACTRTSLMDNTNHQRPRRRRSQSCSLESTSPGLEAKSRTQTLENSLNRTFTFEKEYSFNKTFTIEAKKASHPEALTAPVDANCHSSDKNLMRPNENRQAVLPEESDEAAVVKGEKLNPREDDLESHKNESESLEVSQRNKPQHNAPLSAVNIVINDTRTDASESSFNTSSLSSQNRELLNVLTLVEMSISQPSDSSLTEPFIEPSSPGTINSDDINEADLHDLSKDGLPNQAASKSCSTLQNEGEASSSRLDIPSSENSDKSQNCEELIRKQISLLEDGNQKSLRDMKGIENEEPHSKTLMMEEYNTNGNAGPVQDLENGTQHEELRREIHQTEKVIDDNLNQEMAEEFYEGEEVEVLSTSGIEEEDEIETIRVTPEAFDDNEVEATRAEPLISRKSLRSHIRQLYTSKDGKDLSSDSGNRGDKHVQIPPVKVHCLSAVALTKEVLISPDVSDEECELVSPGVDLSDAKFPTEIDTVEDSVSHKNAPRCFSNLSSQKRNGGINSPHKTIPEEQDESTLPKRPSEHYPKSPALKRIRNSATPPSLSTSSMEKPDDRNLRTRRSLRGVTVEDQSSSPQSFEIPKSATSHTKSPRAGSSIQEEPTATSYPKSMLNTANKSTVEIKGQKRKETVTDTLNELRSLSDSGNSVLISPHHIGKESKGKRLQTNSPGSTDSVEKELNVNISASHKRTSPESTQNQNSKYLCEYPDSRPSPERCEITKSQSSKNSVPDASGGNVREAKGIEKNNLSSHIEEESSGSDIPLHSVRRLHKRLSLSSSSSSSSQPLLPVRRSSRLMKQPSGLSSLIKDSRNPSSSNGFSESEQETEEAEDKSVAGTPKNLRRSMRAAGTPRKAANDVRLLTE